MYCSCSQSADKLCRNNASLSSCVSSFQHFDPPEQSLVCSLLPAAVLLVDTFTKSHDICQAQPVVQGAVTQYVPLSFLYCHEEHLQHRDSALNVQLYTVNFYMPLPGGPKVSFCRVRFIKIDSGNVN